MTANAGTSIFDLEVDATDRDTTVRLRTVASGRRLAAVLTAAADYAENGGFVDGHR